MKYIKNHVSVGLALITLMSASLAAQQPEMFRPNDPNREARQITFRLPFSARAQRIDVEIVAGKIIFEGDIILGDEAMLRAPSLMSAGTNDRRWPDGVIPFTIQANHPKYWEIMAAIDAVNRKTNLLFVKRTTESNYVEFVNGDGCSSFYGRKIGRQEVTVGDCAVGNIIHESLHVAGLYHEQSRSDRDDFVSIKWSNIKAGKESNFGKYKDSEDEIFNGSDIGDYDYGSIMHYGTHFFSKNGEPTIVPVGSVEIGQRNHISRGDLAGLRTMYPVKAKPYEPPVVTNKVNTDTIRSQPNSSPRAAETRRAGGILRQP